MGEDMGRFFRFFMCCEWIVIREVRGGGDWCGVFNFVVLWLILDVGGGGMGGSRRF